MWIKGSGCPSWRFACPMSKANLRGLPAEHAMISTQLFWDRCCVDIKGCSADSVSPLLFDCCSHLQVTMRRLGTHSEQRLLYLLVVDQANYHEKHGCHTNMEFLQQRRNVSPTSSRLWLAGRIDFGRGVSFWSFWLSLKGILSVWHRGAPSAFGVPRKSYWRTPVSWFNAYNRPFWWKVSVGGIWFICARQVFVHPVVTALCSHIDLLQFRNK